MVSPPVVLRAALGAATALAAGLLAVPPAAAAEPRPMVDSDSYQVPPSYDAPLLVTIDALTPGEVPERGPVLVSGTVINRSLETWTGINLYPFINAGPDCGSCPAPITTGAELADAAATEPEAVIGARITEVSDTVDELAPGEVQPYSIRVPRSLLPVTTAGVYWFGVHASGASDGTPRDDFADGRARTFLPYVPRGRDGIGGNVDTAIVVPFRYRIRHLVNGRLARPEAWETAFEPTGALGGPLAFASAAAGRPVTWLIDPAVPDAARQLRRGNPSRDLGPEEVEPDDGDDGDDDGAGGESPTDGATEGAAQPDEEVEPPADDETALAAADWLDALEAQLRGEEVLALPYGDLDMSATPDRMPGLYALSRELEGSVLSQWGTSTQPVVASPGGYLDPTAIDGIVDESTLLLTDRMFGPDEYRLGAPVVGEYEGHRVAATSYGAATGGPGPEPRLGAVAFRQRVLAEAAVRLLAPGRRHPLIVVVPRGVDGTGGTAFWSGLDADWLNLTTVSDATDRTATPIEPDSLTYPPDQENEEIPFSVFSEADQLIKAGRTFQNVLDAGSVADDAQDEALTAASYHYRNDPDRAADRLARSRRWIDKKLRRVKIEGPPAVTLSSADGSFAVTVENRLQRTVTVRIAADAVDNEVEVDVGDPIVLAPKSRTTILLDAHSTAAGVHNVNLSVTDVDGTPLGSSVEVPIRSGQVSQVIWLILGAGGAMLLVAIALRLFRRFRNGGRPDEAAKDPAEPATSGAA